MVNVVKNNVQIDERRALILSFPCFASWTPEMCEAILSKMSAVHYCPQEKIVIENELVDSIYIILSGKAEVTRSATRGKKKKQIPIASLFAGEAIGLNDTGFYSTTGKRSATVTAETDMLLLRLDLNVLHDFLKEHHLEAVMYAAAKKMLRAHFIKQSLPFAKLPHERIQWLADKVKEKIIDAGTIVFHQGEPGSECYLIQSGEIEIFLENEEGKEKRLATLHDSVLFGEATLITHEKRNASARALTKTTLLVLRHHYLSELLESERNTASMFMTLMVDRSRPQQNFAVTMHERLTADGKKLTILKNPDNGTYFKLSEEGAFIWGKLNGKHTLQEITLDLADKFNLFAPDVVAGLISKLTKSGFISNLTLVDETYFPIKSGWKKWFTYVSHLMDKRLTFGDSDKWISCSYNKCIKYLFTKTAQVVLAVLAVAGLVVFTTETPNVLLFFSFKHVSLLLVLGLLPLGLVKVIIHELGHAFAVKAFGREIHYLGVGFNGINPIAFADTSDMWLAKRSTRLLVNVAGIYVDILSAGSSSLLILCTDNPYIQGMLWLFAFYTYLGVFRNLNPTQDTDGYFALMDALEKNRLRRHAVWWLVKKLPATIYQPRLILENKAEMVYWLACLLYLILVTLLTYIVQAFVLTAIGIEQVSLTLTLALPFLVMIISSVSLVMEIRKEVE